MTSYLLVTLSVAFAALMIWASCGDVTPANAKRDAAKQQGG